MNVWRIIGAVIALLFIATLARLTQLENGGPPHAFVTLPGQASPSCRGATARCGMRTPRALWRGVSATR